MKNKKQILPKEESWIFPSTKEYKLPNGELIGGYFTMQGNIGDIFKYKNEELIDKLKYKGPIPYFSIPIGRDLMNKMNANGGKYSEMNKCSLYIPNVCHYSQGCRCYCGHCCSCCTCSHNDLNNPNFPFGLLNKGLDKYFNPESPPSQRQKNQNKFVISGEKGNYHLEYLDKDLYKYKFDITCNQVPILYGVKLDNGDVSMFRNKGNNNSKKNTIPSFKPLGDELLKDILPKFLEKKRNKKNDDEEYKPTKKEVDEIEEEKNPPQSVSKRPNNKKNSPLEPISQSKKDKNNNNNNNNNNPRVSRMIGGRDNDEEYIPTQKELDQAQEEEKPSEKKGGPSSSNKKTEDKNS